MTCPPPGLDNVPRCGATGKIKGRTNLNLSSGSEDKRGGTPSSNLYKIQHGNNSIEGRRLDEHDDDGCVQTTRSGRSPDGISNIPAMQGESCDDHECEEDVE